MSLQHLAVVILGEVSILAFMKLKRLLRTLSLRKKIDSVNLAFENCQVLPLHHELLLFCYLLLFILFSPVAKRSRGSSR